MPDIGRKVKPSLLLLAALILCASHSGAVAGSSKTAAETDPAIAGRKAALNVLSRDSRHDNLLDLILGRADITYPMVCSRYGVLIFSEAANAPELRARLERAYQPFLEGKAKPWKGHVDNNVFGIVPFELHRQTGRSEYLKLAKMLADDEFKDPRPDNLSSYTRFWVDDMYMVGSLQVQAYKSLKDGVYLDRAFAQVLAYCAKLQQQNGLFFHTDKAPYFWGRGNGWAGAAMTELLLAAPEDHPKRGEVLQAYQKMMSALIKYQDPSGLWHQLIDEPESYIESSSSGMFIFALATGVRKGWLPEQPYRAAVEKAWQALPGYLDADGKVREVCIGTSALNNKTHYMTRPRVTGDLHGQAGFLWAATAMYLLEEENKK